jgi:trigger factor
MIAQARRFPGQEQAVLEFLRKNPQAQESLAAPILEDKVIDFILEMAQVSERTVPVEELLRDFGAETTSSPDEDQVRS